jgi:hypothetical protein
MRGRATSAKSVVDDPSCRLVTYVPSSLLEKKWDEVFAGTHSDR